MTKPPFIDDHLIAMLKKREGLLTIAHLQSGEEIHFRSIRAWYDLGDEYHHITIIDQLNPPSEAAFFYTNEIVALVDGDGGYSLYSFPL